MPHLSSLYEHINALDDEIMLYAGQDDPPGREEVDAFHREFGCVLPREYQEFILHFGSLYVEVIEEAWARPKPFAIGAYWTFQYGFHVLGLGEDIPDFLSITLATQQLRSYESAPIVPFFNEVSSSDFYCFDQSGNLCFWSHEEGVLPAEEQNCFEVIENHLQRLVQNKARLKEQAQYREQAQAERLQRKIAARRKSQ